MGNINVNRGRETMYKHITWGKSKHIHGNHNGKRLNKFSAEGEIKMASTSFKRIDIYNSSWTLPDRRYTNQIDHVVIEKWYQRVSKLLQRGCHNFRPHPGRSRNKIRKLPDEERKDEHRRQINFKQKRI